MTPLFFCCNRVSSIFERIAADHFDGADEKYAVKSAGGVKEFDPLRDGPLRYLGYANECGCVHNCWGSRAYVAPFCTLQHARRAPCTWAPCVLSCLLSATCMHARSEAFAAWLPLWGVPMSYAVAVRIRAGGHSGQGPEGVTHSRSRSWTLMLLCIQRLTPPGVSVASAVCCAAWSHGARCEGTLYATK